MRDWLRAVVAHSLSRTALLVTGALLADLARAIPDPSVSEAQRQSDWRVVLPEPLIDVNGNYISDVLGEQVRVGILLAAVAAEAVAAPATQPLADLLVALDHAPEARDARAIETLGDQVLEGWTALVYALRVVLPPAAIGSVAALPRVTLVEENGPVLASLYLSTRQPRARTVWAAPYSNTGGTNHSIAVLDSGINARRGDFSGKVAGWTDPIGRNAAFRVAGYYTSAHGIAGHGSGVAGIIAGLGTARGLGSTLDTTQPVPLYVSTYTPLHTGGPRADTASQPSSFGSPHAVDSATESHVWRAQPYTSLARNDPSPSWVQSRPTMQPIGDGFSLVRGLALGRVAGASGDAPYAVRLRAPYARGRGGAHPSPPSRSWGRRSASGLTWGGDREGSAHGRSPACGS